ncbi:MAG: DUF523 domain-containing protein [Tissierellia bacterium]|nr:DUF523 domain-containing protein [Tissierellia bacterium]
MSDYYVYILKCSDNTLYTGSTNNISNRLLMHNIGKGAKYTRGRCPSILMYLEHVENRSLAVKREEVIKKLKLDKKVELINSATNELFNGKIMVSACLLGDSCRYDGKAREYPNIIKWSSNKNIIPFCPEVEGGLLTPRLPSEILGDNVINSAGEDVTEYFLKGAEAAIEKCDEEGIVCALLKANSPSCGCRNIYDGTFSKKLVPGMGFTAKKLSNRGIAVFDEDNFPF